MDDRRSKSSGKYCWNRHSFYRITINPPNYEHFCHLIFELYRLKNLIFLTINYECNRYLVRNPEEKSMNQLSIVRNIFNSSCSWNQDNSRVLNCRHFLHTEITTKADDSQQPSRAPAAEHALLPVTSLRQFCRTFFLRKSPYECCQIHSEDVPKTRKSFVVTNCVNAWQSWYSFMKFTVESFSETTNSMQHVVW